MKIGIILAKSISEHYKLLNLDTGKIYRYLAFLKIKNPSKFGYKFLKTKINKLKSWFKIYEIKYV